MRLEMILKNSQGRICASRERQKGRISTGGDNDTLGKKGPELYGGLSGLPKMGAQGHKIQMTYLIEGNAHAPFSLQHHR
jgi:hypothetical protein